MPSKQAKEREEIWHSICQATSTTSTRKVSTTRRSTQPATLSSLLFSRRRSAILISAAIAQVSVGKQRLSIQDSWRSRHKLRHQIRSTITRCYCLKYLSKTKQWSRSHQIRAAWGSPETQRTQWRLMGQIEHQRMQSWASLTGRYSWRRRSRERTRGRVPCEKSLLAQECLRIILICKRRKDRPLSKIRRHLPRLKILNWLKP